jgi:hypothetical protein
VEDDDHKPTRCQSRPPRVHGAAAADAHLPPGTWIAAGNNPSGGSQDFCFLVFNKITTPVAPRLRWLSRDGSES